MKEQTTHNQDVFRGQFRNKFQTGSFGKDPEENPYADMLHMERPVSTVHAQMPRSDRAAQFAPFAALTGHGAAIQETARLTESRIELDEDSKALLEERVQALQKKIEEHPEVILTYFQQDSQKEGGVYQILHGNLKRIDQYAQALVMMDGSQVGLEDIVGIEMI